MPFCLSDHATVGTADVALGSIQIRQRIIIRTLDFSYL